MSNGIRGAPAPSRDPDWKPWRDWELLLICSVAVAAAFLLDVRDNRCVGYGFSLPPLCGSRAVFGVDCPGCGLTRSIIHLAHGRWGESFAAHRLGWLMGLAILLQLPYRTLCLLRAGGNPVPRAIRRTFTACIIVALLGNWLVKMWTEVASGT